MKTIHVSPGALALCSVKADVAADMSRSEISDLMAWCDCQSEHLWDDMTLQEILNVYRASAEYETWQGWAEDNRKAAHAAWNKAVIAPSNKMLARATH